MQRWGTLLRSRFHVNSLISYKLAVLERDQREQRCRATRLTVVSCLCLLRVRQVGSTGRGRRCSWASARWCGGWSCSCRLARRPAWLTLRTPPRCGACATAMRRSVRAGGAPTRPRACPGGASSGAQQPLGQELPSVA